MSTIGPEKRDLGLDELPALFRTRDALFEAGADGGAGRRGSLDGPKAGYRLFAVARAASSRSVVVEPSRAAA